MDSSLKDIYYKIPYLQEHKKMFIEFYTDIEGNHIYTVKKKKKNGTVKDIAMVKIVKNDFCEMTKITQSRYKEYRNTVRLINGFPLFKTYCEALDEVYIDFVADKINEKIRMMNLPIRRFFKK